MVLTKMRGMLRQASIRVVRWSSTVRPVSSLRHVATLRSEMMPSLWYKYLSSTQTWHDLLRAHHHHHHHIPRERSFSSKASRGNKILARPEEESNQQTKREGVASSSSSSSSSSPSKFALPDKEREKELSRIQVEIQEQYRAGDYRRALKASIELQKETEHHFGKDHPATASAYNNVGLMHKQLGEFDESRRSYQTALRIYKRTVGADHASYASILHNLGNLNRSQIHFDTSLKATDRLTLIEQAAKYLEQAWKIRVDEMGPDHPHTVASQSSWGATMATQILHHHKASSSSTATTNSTITAGKIGPRSYISLLPKDVTEQAWNAAETHLRQALQTAIANPRGPSLPKEKKGSITKKRSSSSPSKGSDNAITTATSIQTLSAAAASQNLAIFLKAKATTTTPFQSEWLAEARQLYQDTLAVRTQLLPKGHPDLYATKFSLAELLETLGEGESANQVRQEIIDTYDPQEEEKSDTDEKT